MARILYGVAGEGNGHAIRSKIIIDELRKDHHITIFSYGENYKTLMHFFQQEQTVRILGCHMYYVNNAVSAIITSVVNVLSIPFILLASLKYVPHMLRKPDLVITDFEPFICYWALLFNVPIISIDNQHMMTHTKIDCIKGQFFYKIYSKLLINLFVPHPKKIFITTFFYPPQNKKAIIVPPLIKKEIHQQKPSNKGYVLVYQTSSSYRRMLPILKKINKNFIVYGFNKEAKEENCTFKKFNNDHFNKDLAEADAVIINGGFTTLTEALYLKKPIFSIPVKRQFEQILNGHYINKLGYGMSVKNITINNFTRFMKNKKYYQKNIGKIKWDKNEKFFDALRNAITILERKNNINNSTFIDKP